MEKNNNQVAVLPSLKELHHDAAKAFKNDALNLLLNQPVPQKWVKRNPFVKIEVPDGRGGKMKVESEYIPIDKVKFLLTRIFQEWNTEIVSYQALFNAVAVHVRLKVKNPITGEWIIHDGVGAVDVQTKAGASPADLSQINSAAVMKALPAASSYALKNAAEKLGGIFGGNLQKQDILPFTGAYMTMPAISYDDLKELFDLKFDALTKEEQEDAQRILENKETNSYASLHKTLSSK